MNAKLHTLSDALSHALFRIQSAVANRNTKIGNTHVTRSSASQNGEVFIVGAGPGDADLLTVKAYRLLQTADVVLFDWLVDQTVLDCIPRHIKKEFVGKRCGKHSMPQDFICQRLVELGLEGKRVVRLKGGIQLYLHELVKKPLHYTMQVSPLLSFPELRRLLGRPHIPAYR